MDDIYNIQNDSHVSTGQIIKINYGAVSSICDSLEIIKNDLIEQWQEISSILQEKDTIWQGEAATRFFNGISKINTNAIETTEAKALPGHIQSVREIIELNRQVDSQLNDINLSTVEQTAPTIQANNAFTDAVGVNTDLNNSVKTNGNIQSNEASLNASGVDTEINESVRIDNNVSSNDANVVANGIDTELIDRISINNNIR